MALLAPRRGMVGGTQGQLWGQGDAPPLEFYESCIGNVIARLQKYIKMLINISCFSPQSESI